MLAIGKLRQYESGEWRTIIPRAEISFSLNVRAPFMRVSGGERKLYFFVQDVVRHSTNPKSGVSALTLQDNGALYGVELHTLYDGATRLGDAEYAAFVQRLLATPRVDLECSALRSTVVPSAERYELFRSAFCEAFDQADGPSMKMSALVNKVNEVARTRPGAEKFSTREVEELLAALGENLGCVRTDGASVVLE